MTVDVDLGDVEDADEMSVVVDNRDPDEFLARNAFRVVYQTNNFLLPQIRDMIDRKEAINLHPEYQRRLRWTTAQKSRLIESLLLNIPIPPVFFYESDAARYEVMDGQQRLNTIREFFSGSFALVGLKVLSPLNGIRYPKAPPRVKRTLDRASISAIVLLMESESEISGQGTLALTDIRRLVFDRLNTGGMKLNAQELRNAQNPGPFNDAIVELSRYSLFTEVFGIPAYTEKDPEDYYINPERQKNNLYSTMKDCELVLRYFALRDPDNIRGSMKSMLDRAMEVRLTPEKADLAKKEFREQFKFLYDLFGKNPFAVPSRADGRERVSAAIYDAAMVAANRNWLRRDEIVKNRDKVISRMKEVIDSGVEYEVLIGRGNTAESVKDRIDLLQKILLAS
ncbi:hypothetical protein CCR83_03975 [Rhodobacter veldkampii DSM 11550]|uniref:DUF262 domain-containing protein n=1 Tax=Phaeovulum veldkampii DSM 11550 TaxID=1185920 RepID=A0A2T4JH57_9RHOB|nr:DUF262 domain-containing protein [Phaeovulum veldkampii]MBK5945628.1 hypothetical protein [Phaeovulum veldkampii DSM 11550]PTE17236.1 DUF262 domain-containing protein [Phaeovulum veldkampii DSM 11550]TDQ56245.1 uncharacterized protein DUF262 [Phaeovulum veldkampii DSM 11550]